MTQQDASVTWRLHSKVARVFYHDAEGSIVDDLIHDQYLKEQSFINIFLLYLSFSALTVTFFFGKR